ISTATTPLKSVQSVSSPAMLNPGASYDLQGTYQLPDNISPGAYYVGLLADTGNTVRESDETNNYAATPLQVLPGPADSHSAWRLQVKIETGDYDEGAGTDDDVSVEINSTTKMWLDYGRNDFERGDSFTYDLGFWT